MEENFDLDLEEGIPMIPVDNKPTVKTTRQVKKTNTAVEDAEKPLINCLRNERIQVKFIPKESGMITNPKHILHGGMSESAFRTFVVPRLTSGMYVNVLTDDEKRFLENLMGLEDNALSIYKKQDNFWDDGNTIGISKVTLHKFDNYLNLADPEDYIRYKILLANKDYICPNLATLQTRPKATYQFVMTSEAEENKALRSNMDIRKACYKAVGKIEDDKETLATILEIIDGRPVAPNSTLEFLQTKVDNLIFADSKLLWSVLSDAFLPTKVLIRRAKEKGLIADRGGFLYLREDNSPLCEHNEEPNLNIASKYLNSPKRQEIKFMLEAKLKD